MATTKYIWNVTNDTVLMEKDGNGTTTAEYNSDPVPYGRLFSMRRGAETYNYRYDAQGNTRALTDNSGQITDTYRYDAWGTQNNESGLTANPYRYGGQDGYQYNSATIDYYVRARMYQPKLVRWQSKDALRFEDGMNPYVYAGNCVVNAIDPSGLLKITVDSRSHELCGGVDITFGWAVEDRVGLKRLGGYVISKVCSYERINYCLATCPPCPGCGDQTCDLDYCRDAHKCCFWEALTLDAGEAGKFTDQHKKIPLTPPGCPSSRGDRSNVVEVRFYRSNEISNAEVRKFKRTNDASKLIPCLRYTTGTAFVRMDAPSVWKRPHPKNRTGHFWFHLHWDCCRNPPIKNAQRLSYGVGFAESGKKTDTAYKPFGGMSVRPFRHSSCRYPYRLPLIFVPIF